MKISSVRIQNLHAPLLIINEPSRIKYIICTVCIACQYNEATLKHAVRGSVSDKI